MSEVVAEPLDLPLVIPCDDLNVKPNTVWRCVLEWHPEHPHSHYFVRA